MICPGVYYFGRFMNYIEIRCQVEDCPYNMKKNQRCCFGEIDIDGRTEPVRERHKCERAKAKDPLRYVIVNIPMA